MKAVCLALVLANLGFFAWAQWHATNDKPDRSDSVSDVPQLVLASEADDADRQAAPSSEAETAAAVSTPAALSIAQEPVTPSARQSESPAHVARCVSVGPFHDLPDATQAAAALRGKGFEPRTRAREGDVWAGLWVYIENLPSRSEAQQAMNMLKERGITDAYIMPSTASALNISLGIFSESARAQRRATEVRALGFTPTISDRTRKGTVYWLDTNLKPTDSMIVPADLQGDAGRIVRLEVRTCPSRPGNGR